MKKSRKWPNIRIQKKKRNIDNILMLNCKFQRFIFGCLAHWMWFIHFIRVENREKSLKSILFLFWNLSHRTTKLIKFSAQIATFNRFFHKEEEEEEIQIFYKCILFVWAFIIWMDEYIYFKGFNVKITLLLGFCVNNVY